MTSMRRRTWLRAGVLGGIAGLSLVVGAILLLGGETEDALQASPVLFNDDFSDRSSGWKEDGRESRLAAVSDGRYHIQVQAGRGTDFAWLSPESSEVLFPTNSANLSMQVDAQRISGGSNPSDSYGIFCRAEYGDHDYRFDLARQRVSILKFDTDEGFTELESETVPTGIDLDASNDIHATCRTIEQGGAVSLELAMNGDVVADVTDRDSPFLAGTVGIYAFTEGTLEVAFDNLIVNKN